MVDSVIIRCVNFNYFTVFKESESRSVVAVFVCVINPAIPDIVLLTSLPIVDKLVNLSPLLKKNTFTNISFPSLRNWQLEILPSSISSVSSANFCALLFSLYPSGMLLQYLVFLIFHYQKRLLLHQSCCCRLKRN